MIESDQKYLVALNSFIKFGPIRLKKLQKSFPNWQLAFKASANELSKTGLEKNIIDEFIAYRTTIDPEALFDRMLSENIKIITLTDDKYPKLLKEISNPPLLLYYLGQIYDPRDEYSVSIVGSRKFTSYGRQATEMISRDLARNNLAVISGLAMGIDSIAHDETLKNNGRTVAVLGTGLDRQSIYPSINRYLSDKIVAMGGAVISEFPLGMAPLKFNFPQRNRIIAGLSLGTLVIEAAEKSGSLITAQFALEQNREIFALPGGIFSPLSAGTNNLIKQGAKPVTCANDIIEALNLTMATNYIETKKIIPETKEEEVILPLLTNEPIHINDIIRTTGLDTSLINSTLIIMEMKGMVKNLGNMQYILAR